MGNQTCSWSWAGLTERVRNLMIHNPMSSNGVLQGFRVHRGHKESTKNGNLGNCREIHLYIDACNMESHDCNGISMRKNSYISFGSPMSSQFHSPQVSNFLSFSKVSFRFFFFFIIIVIF